MQQVAAKLRLLDLNPKLADEFKTRTVQGASVSVLAVLLMFVFFCYEVADYWTIDKVELMQVDGGRFETFRINFDITLPKTSCHTIGIDVMDSVGHHQVGVLNHVFKQRVDASGKPFGTSEKHKEGLTLKSPEEVLQKSAHAGVSTKDECGDCYGAGEPGQCCNTCDEVRSLYRSRGWGFSGEAVAQCREEMVQAMTNHTDSTAQEGCNLYGYMDVPKANGHVQIAPSKMLQHTQLTVEDLLRTKAPVLDVSHKIKHLSFGTYFPGAVNPLDGATVDKEVGSGLYQYFLKVVPTTYIPKSGHTIVSNQYSTTKHYQTLAADDVQHLPGIQFHFEFSPIKAHIEERGKSFVTFLVRLCAIVGGVYTTMGFVDSVMHAVLVKLKSTGLGGILG